MKEFSFAILKQKAKRVDWPLLLFLVLVLNVKLVVKLVGLLFIYLVRRNFHFRFSLKPPAIPLFYPAMIVIALVNFVVYALYSRANYSFLVLTGIGFWMVCILVFHQLSFAMKRSPLSVLHNTVTVFFLLNILFSAGSFLWIIMETGSLNPYRYQGMYQKYFIGTGDYIRGISFDTSTTNAILNALGVVYFLFRRQMLLSILCMSVMLLTSSNFTNLLMVACLLLLFILKSNRVQKSMITVYFSMMVAFLVNVSPQNNDYAINIAGKTLGRTDAGARENIIPADPAALPDSMLTVEQRKERAARTYLDSVTLAQQTAGDTPVKLPVLKIPKVNIYAPEYERKADSSAIRLQAIHFIRQMAKDSADPPKKLVDSASTGKIGKILAFQQLLQFMREHPLRSVTGNGTGNFSSKLAFRATGLRMAGGYPSSRVYLHEDFKQNHLAVYLTYFAEDARYHSIVNSPNSVYAQVAGEYGVAGLVCLLFLYVGYFLRRINQLSYGLAAGFIMAGAFVADYWFEQLSVVIVFELLMLLNLAEANRQAHE